MSLRDDLYDQTLLADAWDAPTSTNNLRLDKILNPRRPAVRMGRVCPVCLHYKVEFREGQTWVEKHTCEGEFGSIEIRKWKVCSACGDVALEHSDLCSRCQNEWDNSDNKERTK